MAISIERYVSITSGVIGAQAVAQRELIALRFSTDPRVPVGSHVVASNAGDVLDYFGAASPEYAYASQYFAYTSPAPSSRPAKLRFAAYADVARPARVYGDDGDITLLELQEITNGSLIITLAGVTETISAINLSEAISFLDVCATLTNAISTKFSGSSVSFNALNGSFDLVTGSVGNADISLASTPLSEVLHWNIGAIYSPGSVVQTPLEALREAEQVTDSFGSFSFLGSLPVADVVSVAQYNASLNIKYMYLQSVTPIDAQAIAAAAAGIKSVGVVLNGTAGQYKEALPQAIMAATNYQRRNATVNYMYRQLSGMTADVSTDSMANTYDALRVNYYGETASAGQKIAFFQRGFLMGDAVDPLDMNVHANEQWLKAYLTATLLSLQLTIGKIPANQDGRGYVLAQVVDAAEQGKFNGSIITAKTFTTAQKIAITQLTGDGDAWREVQANGFWADSQVVERTGESGATEYVIQYTLCYSKNDVVRKIEGSHNLV